MSDELIEGYLDRPKVKEDTDFLEGELNKVIELFDKVNKIKISLQGASSLKDVVAASKQGTAAINELTNAEKEHSKMADQIVQSQAKVNAGRTDEAKQLASLKEAQRQRNIELRNQVLLDEAAEGSIQQMRAQLILLQREYDKLGVAEREGTKGQGLLDQIQGIDTALKTLEGDTGRFQRNVGNYTGAVKILEAALTTAKAKLDAMTTAERNNTAEGQRAQKEFDLLGRLVGQQEAGFSSISREIQATSRALATMQQNGLENTQGFKELQITLAEAQRGLTEFRNQQHLLSAEVPAIAGLTAAARGLGAAYAVGAGTAALFANGNEHVEKELQKLVAIMTILQGLSEVNSTLQERTAIATSLQSLKQGILNGLLAIKNFILKGSITAQVESTAAQEANIVVSEAQAGAMTATTVATTAATFAMRAFRFALIATGIGALIVLLIETARAFDLFGDHAGGAKEQMEKFNDEIERGNKITDEHIHNLDVQGKHAIELMRQRGASEAEVAQEELRQIRAAEVEKFKSYERQNKGLEQFNAETLRLKQKIADDAKEVDPGLIDPDVLARNVKAQQDALQKSRDEISKKTRESVEQTHKEATDLLEQGNAKEDDIKTKAYEDAHKKDKKAHAESLQGLKEALDNEFDLYKIDQNRKIKTFDDEAKDEKLSLSKRIDSLIKFHDAQRELNDKQLEEDERLLRAKAALEVQRLEEEKKGKTGPQAARIDANIAIVQGNLEKEVQTLHAKSRDAQIDIDKDYLHNLGDIMEKDFKKTSDQYDKDVEKFRKAQEQKQRIAHAIIDTDTNTQEFALRAQFEIDAAGKSADKRQKLEEKLGEAIDELHRHQALLSLQLDEKLLESKRAILLLTKQSTAEVDAAITANEVEQQKIREANYKAHLSAKEKARNDDLDKILEYETAASDLIVSIADGKNTREKNRLQDEIDLITKKTETEINGVNATTLTAEQKAARIQVIQLTAQAQKEALELRQRRLDQQRAKFERDAGILQIGIEIAIAIAKQHYEAAALAGVALIKALATPLPRFKSGKYNKYEGFAITNDGGKPEPIYRAATGAVEISKSVNNITYLNRDDIVYSSMEDMMKRMSAPKTKVVVNNTNTQVDISGALSKQTNLLARIADKRELSLHATDRGMVALWKHGANTTKYINENTNW